MVIIGITGQTGAGKTTALRGLETLGGYTIVCDGVYHNLLRTSKSLLQELEERFGGITDDSGVIQRKKLGAIVFASKTDLQDLNEITHRHIAAAVEAKLAVAREKNCPAVAIDAIRLIESGLGELCHSVVAITASREVRIERIMNRENITREYAKSRVDAQQDEEFYIKNAQYVLNSDGNKPTQLEERARHIFEEIMSDTEGTNNG